MLSELKREDVFKEIFKPDFQIKLPPANISKVERTNSQSSQFYNGYTTRQLKVVVISALVNVCASVIYALQAPFYPKEAESKGTSPTEYGFVFGVFQLVVCIMSPINGYILGFANPKTVFSVGIFVIAACSTLFGFLDFVKDHVTFVGLSFALRILQGCGDASFVTASFTIIAMEFPENVATTFALLETFWGLGTVIGPGIGGFLYEIGGFRLPFVCMGGCFFLIAILSNYFLPDTSTKNNFQAEAKINFEREDAGSSMIAILQVPVVGLALLSVIVAMSTLGFLVATLEPHLRENFALTPTMTGLVFMIDGVMYAVFAPIWGKFVDKSRQPKMFTIYGALLTIIGFMFIGPAPFIPLPTILWLSCVGLVFHSLGTGATIVSSFILAMKGAVENGSPDNVSTYGNVSGLFTSLSAFGSFVGPSVGGVLLDSFGFQMSSIYVLVTQSIVVFVTLAFLCAPDAFKRKYYNVDTELEPEKETLLKQNTLDETDLEFQNKTTKNWKVENTVGI